MTMTLSCVKCSGYLTFIAELNVVSILFFSVNFKTKILFVSQLFFDTSALICNVLLAIYVHYLMKILILDYLLNVSHEWSF